eukprot:3543917-Heterocapsa_arctica.AAC.1
MPAPMPLAAPLGRTFLTPARPIALSTSIAPQAFESMAKGGFLPRAPQKLGNIPRPCSESCQQNETSDAAPGSQHP